MQSIIEIKICTSHVIDIRGGEPFKNYCGSVCRAGGKPSTRFPPGTRGADKFSKTSLNFSYLERYSNPEFLRQLHFLQIF